MPSRHSQLTWGAGFKAGAHYAIRGLQVEIATLSRDGTPAPLPLWHEAKADRRPADDARQHAGA
jgi:hypothetical protein